MQRSITDQKPLTPIIYTALFVVYISLSSIYLFLPPMFGVLFVIFSKVLKDENSLGIFLVSFCLLVFESEKGYTLFTSVIYFIILYRFIIPKLQQNFSCISCIKFLSIVFVYIGFYLFCLLLANIFLLPLPNITYYIIYYIVIEFLIVSII
jgi:hypothetical protein